MSFHLKAKQCHFYCWDQVLIPLLLLQDHPRVVPGSIAVASPYAQVSTVSFGWTLSAIGPHDAKIVLLEQLRCLLGDNISNLTQLPAILLPAQIDSLANEALVEPCRFISYLEAWADCF